MNKHAKNRAGLKILKDIKREYQMVFRALGVGNLFAVKSMIRNIMRKADELYLIMKNNKRKDD